MPQTSLTPLGRQLRSVLANLRPAISTFPPPSGYSNLAPHQQAYDSRSQHARLSSCPIRRARSYHVSSGARSVAAAVASHDSEPEAIAEYEPQTVGDVFRKIPVQAHQLSRRQLNRRTRVNRITEALKSTGQAEVAAAVVRERPFLSHVNFRNPAGRQEYKANRRRHENDFIPSLAQAQEPRLERILARYIKYRALTTGANRPVWISPSEIGQAERASSYAVRSDDISLLNAKGYALDDVKAWADIISPLDSLEAAQALAKRTAAHGWDAVPLFVLLYLLRRSYIRARALRIITDQTWNILNHHTSVTSGEYHVPGDAVFMIYSRLTRHAREVWPMALESLPEILLQYLPNVQTNESNLSSDQRETLTYMLNKAMRLLAVPTAVKPFKSNHFQEAGIVRILRFMTEHDPPLQINREGYRAVILLQLAQRKRPSEQEWAELKAHSWPPWKEDRTAMDSDITFEKHGMSKAAETLKRMREAGYGHHEWEKVASIYTGWDTDRTPTVQTLVLLGTGGDRFRTGAAEWVARITTTRTAQEAWACFLAYEDKKLPPDQDVYLAVFRKLHEEEQRLATLKGRRYSHRERGLYPGDVREVEPLPPSIHLYTYTRTPPPTVDGFYNQLRKRGVAFKGHCLAFLVANAGNLQQGLEYVMDSATRYPELRKLLQPSPEQDLTQMSSPIFAAFIQLLSRFSNVPFPRLAGTGYNQLQFHPVIQHLVDRNNLNGNHTLVRAIDLLAHKRSLFRPAWNSVLLSLARDVSFPEIATVFIQRLHRRPDLRLSLEQEKIRGAIVAYRIMRRVRNMMRGIHLDLDVAGFQALCQGVENVGIGCWKTLVEERRNGEKHLKPHIISAFKVMNSEPIKRLKADFEILVGNHLEDVSPEEVMGVSRDLPLRRLLEVPSPGVLHSYVRALGWMADHEALLDTVRWMAANHDELSLRRERDRNGEAMMRKTIVAVRVFLERSWLSKPEDAWLDETEFKGWSADLRKILHRLETPASEVVIDEARKLVESVDGWGGWPDDEATQEYCRHSRFEQFR